MKKPTPAMQQYYQLKELHPDAMLFFRMGDFYELFDEDAKVAARVLGLTLTSRNKKSEHPQPMAGMPYHARDRYTAELLKQGFKIAIAEQVSDPKHPGIVQREITELLTPGTTMQAEALEAKRHNYLATVSEYQDHYGLAYVDITTGTFAVTQCASLQKLYEEVLRIQPRELVLPQDLFVSGDIQQTLGSTPGLCISTCSALDKGSEEALLCQQYQIHSLAELQLEQQSVVTVRAAAGIIHVLRESRHGELAHLHPPQSYSASSTMQLNISTIRNLELFATSYDGQREGSVIGVLDQTQTAAGGRMLRQWMLGPLLQKQQIIERHEAVDYWWSHPVERKRCRALLHNTYDIERILAKLATERATARDLLALRESIAQLEELHGLVAQATGMLHTELASLLGNQEISGALYILLDTALHEEPPVTLLEGNLIKAGFDPEVDEARTIVQGGKQWILEYQQRLQEETGINSLKVSFNKVFGYYIEVTKTHASKVPSSFDRKQTLTNAERFTTAELNAYEHKVLQGESTLFEREYTVFQQIRSQVLTHLSSLQEIARALACVDVLSTFAEVAYSNSYIRPEIHEEFGLEIQDGRHPVIEAMLRKTGEEFIPNDLQFQSREEEIHIITGPNMAGKSTYLRQNALILFLAQIGSFVPATKAVLPVVDQIYTRIGAHDHLSQGLSTFMVEMKEAADILTHATERSFIILDEIGRGTSTYDGLSLAWGIVKYIEKHIGAKTLFATHYHELVELADTHPHIKNYCVTVSETSEGVVFLRKIARGGIGKSYGIDVAKLAGIPKEVLEFAKEQLHILEKHPSTHQPAGEQLSFFSAPQIIEKEIIKESALEEALKKLHPERMAPLDALQWIYTQREQLLPREESTSQ